MPRSYDAAGVTASRIGGADTFPGARDAWHGGEQDAEVEQ
jgi:hypothetical protein